MKVQVQKAMNHHFKWTKISFSKMIWNRMIIKAKIVKNQELLINKRFKFSRKMKTFHKHIAKMNSKLSNKKNSVEILIVFGEV